AVACSKRLPNKAYQHVWPKIRTRDSEDIPCIFPVMQGIGVAAIWRNPIDRNCSWRLDRHGPFLQLKNLPTEQNGQMRADF
ncbi:MAG TPA: hypothetical protein VFI93_11875, partial [Rhizomicrobium sp.]|nr:hypothetical protein [Rhizomicrobium sp.]